MAINKLVTTIIMLIITLMVMFLFVLPKYQEFKDLEQSIIQKQSEYQAMADYYAKITKLFSDIESRREVLTKVDSALKEDISFAPLIYFLQIKGIENGLVVKSIVPPKDSLESYKGVAPKKNTKEVKPAVFNISLFGSYQNLKKFLSALDNSAQLMQVNSVSLSALAVPLVVKSSKIQNQKGGYDFNLEIQTYTY